MVDLSRRRMLRLLGMGLLTPYVLTFHRNSLAANPPSSGILRSEGRDVFSLSVMSGDPSATGVVLWTRLEPAAYRSGEPLRFQVADDAAFTFLVLEGVIAATELGAATDYTARVDLDGKLQPNRRYHYRFIYAGIASPIGRCRTAPAAGTSVAKLDFALVSCQDYTNGYYNAFAALAEQDVDFVLHLGDFIYESAADPRFQSLSFADRQVILPSGAKVALNLEDYRQIYRTYRADPNFQRCLEQHTFIVIWDDHETANDCYWDYARDTLGAPDHPYTVDPRYGNDPALLRQLKLDAQRAWLEYVPARVQSKPGATHPHDYLSIYRRLRFGDLVELFLTDERSYRSPHPCGEGDVLQRYLPLGCTKYDDPSQTMLGSTQRDWFLNALAGSSAQWKLWANEVALAEIGIPRNNHRTPINVDAWDGFMHERRTIARAALDARVENLLVASGDFHSYLVSYVDLNYPGAGTPQPGNTVASEFMTTSITSANGLDSINNALKKQQRSGQGYVPLGNNLIRANNPHIRFFDSGQHGYSVLRLTPEYCQWSAYVVDKNAPQTQPQARLFRRFKRLAGDLELIDQRLAVAATALAPR